MSSTNSVTPATAKVVASRLAQLAKLLTERPSEVIDALQKLSGSLPGFPDPVFLPPKERHSYVTEIAEPLGVNGSELLLLGDALSKLAPREPDA